MSTIAADVNRDGRMDLIGATGALDLQLALGRGDGTFGVPRSLGSRARPMGVGDFNRDGHLDVVITGVAILPGRGDGTFGSPRIVDASAAPPSDLETFSRGVVADFNGDALLDLALLDDGFVCIYPGRGDFTFDARAQLLASESPLALVGADFNNDRRMDLGATTANGSLDVFMNQGGLLFSAASVPVGFDIFDVASGDLNKDGRQDLVLARSHWTHAGMSPGAFDVLLGNGNGTFQSAVTHGTGARGAWSVVIGDFNQDGHPDVATGNRSTLNVDTSCTGFVYWDSVTIVPGAGNGTFGVPATFRLGTRNWLDEAYQNSHNGLTTGDLDGDGRMDLIASPGALLLSRAALANRNPVVSAGPDQTIDAGAQIRFEAVATDADGNWLTFEWTDASGAVVGPRFDEVRGLPLFCYSVDAGTYTVRVTDGSGGVATDSFTVFSARDGDARLMLERPGLDETLGSASPFTIRWSSYELRGVAAYRLLASADNGKSWTAIPGCASLPATATQCTWNAPGPVTDHARVQVEAFDAAGAPMAFDASERFRIVSGPTTALPAGWQHAEVGTTGATGSATYDGTTFTVAGAGSDIWGTADAFHWAFTLMSGDFDLVARVKSVANVHEWTKAGLMVREQLLPGARHASLFVTPTPVKGVAFQRRPTTGGTSVSTAGPAMTAPLWLRLSRVGNQVRAFYRTTETGSWTAIGTETFSSLSHTLQVGVAVSSHVHGTLATGTFDNVVATAVQLPAGWANEDIGSVSAAGSADATGSMARVTGSGADIWGTADEFHWVYRPATGDFSIEALVDSVENVDPWTKAGLMIRASSSAGSQHAAVFATPSTEKGVAFQGRSSNNGSTIHRSSSPVDPPAWLRLTRRGTNINAYFRKTRAHPWTHMGRIDLPGLPATVKVGFAVTSHRDGTLATARFSQIAIEPVLTWTTSQIGPGAAGSYVDGTFFTPTNRGADIWGRSDAFTYVHTRWSGDGAITARLNYLDFADPWTKAGVMFRDSLAPGSQHAFMLASPERGSAFQYRASADGTSASAGTFARNSPGEFDRGFWLQIVREGNVFRAYLSADAFRWDQVGQVVVPMGTTVYVGLAVTSHNVTLDASGHFDEVTARRAPFHVSPTPPLP